MFLPNVRFHSTSQTGDTQTSNSLFHEEEEEEEGEKNLTGQVVLSAPPPVGTTPLLCDPEAGDLSGAERLTWLTLQPQ